MKNIDVLILCGGQGTRLREVVCDRPKPMVQINGRPFLDILIDNASKYEFRRYILCVCYMGEVIENYYIEKDGPEEILFSYEDMPLGTGGAVKNAEKLINSSPFLVMNGDSFCPVDIRQFLDFHSKKEALASTVVINAENTGDYGLIVLDGLQKIVRFEEKCSKEKAFINAGMYLFEKDVLYMIPPNTKYSLEYDLFPRLADKEFYGYITQERLIDIGTPERYEQGRSFFFK